jgi:hypothetical protein
VNDLIRAERATKVLLHHITMFKDALSATGNDDVDVPATVVVPPAPVGEIWCGGVAPVLPPLVVQRAPTTSYGFSAALRNGAYDGWIESGHHTGL